MHGPAPAHPPHQSPARGTVVTLRVLFVAATVLSLGFLAWAALLRAALVQRKPLGWWLFGADLVLLVLVMLTGSHPETDWRTNVQVAAILVQMVGAVAYYLVVDIRAAQPAGYGPPGSPPQEAGYGYPPAASPGGHAAHPGAPYGYQPAPAPYGPPPQPAPAPIHAQETQPYAPESRPPHANPYSAPQGAGYGYPPAAPHERPQRIDRVRAELDELSDYLRKEEGR
ncbi:hypothetical protein AB0I10_35045 [Streptomyces sp. NPDC050636]|uniref:hypothetical protein n=1 Tax=Streptomyces sp. NPDC050636 TaxID=3154510 RepID=UPI00344923E3